MEILYIVASIVAASIFGFIIVPARHRMFSAVFTVLYFPFRKRAGQPWFILFTMIAMLTAWLWI